MKTEYIKQLRERLLDYNISDELLEFILDEYEHKIESYKEKHLSDAEIQKIIGDFRYEVNCLVEKYNLKLIEEESKQKNKIIALTPFVSIIVFFILGFGFELWNPGWLVFLLIPIVAIMTNVFHKEPMNAMIAISPFLVVIAYLSIGFALDVWHPTWLVFLLIPIMGIFSGFKTMRFISFLTAISPFISLVAYILLGYFFNLWNSAWIVFYLVPIFGVLHEKKLYKLIIFEASLLISAFFALYVIEFTGYWGLSFVAVLFPLIVFIIFGEDSVLKLDKTTSFSFLIFVTLFIVYLLSGLIYQAWGYMWMIFLIIPMYEIIRQSPNNLKYVSITPFIAVIIFFSLGYFFGLWHVSWLAFLLIPITAILDK
jgi:hypothetical protein